MKHRLELRLATEAMDKEAECLDRQSQNMQTKEGI